MVYFIDTIDERNKYLKQLLLERGKKVLDFDTACLKNAKAKDTLVFSPAKKLKVADVEDFPDGINIVCGNVTTEVDEQFIKKSITHKNLMDDEKFAIKNAMLTAEGVLAIILEKSKKSIFENKILILGNGRICTALAVLFGKMGVDFGIVAYDLVKVPKFYIYTDNVYHGNDFFKHIMQYDIIVNTIPAKIIGDEKLEAIPKGCIFIETASVPCLDQENVVSFDYILAPGLPQKYSAKTAGKLMMDYILGEN